MSFTVKKTTEVMFELWEVDTRRQTSRYGIVSCEDKDEAFRMADSFTENSAEHLEYTVVKATTVREAAVR